MRGAFLHRTRKKDMFWNKSDNKGLISEDRSNKATLQLTIPRSLFKSYAKDLSSRNIRIGYR